MNRQDIYAAVWKEPLSVVAKRLSLSATALRNACVAADIPVPPRGHWVKASIGRAPDPKPLHGRKDELFVFRRGEFARGGSVRAFEAAQLVAIGVVKANPRPTPIPMLGMQQLDARLSRLEAASQQWVREQQLLAFLDRLEEALAELPETKSAEPLSALRSTRAALRSRDPLLAALATLTANRV